MPSSSSRSRSTSALGASPTAILRFVVGHGLRLSAADIFVGLLAALALMRGMTTMLVGVRPWLPARRAAGLDPTAALREG